MIQNQLLQRLKHTLIRPVNINQVLVRELIRPERLRFLGKKGQLQVIGHMISLLKKR
nr:MAG TPA: hypothetical protein [Caudoviricetes sp.]